MKIKLFLIVLITKRLQTPLAVVRFGFVQNETKICSTYKAVWVLSIVASLGHTFNKRGNVFYEYL